MGVLNRTPIFLKKFKLICMENYSFLKQKIKILNDMRNVNQKKLSLNGVLKPLNIGSISSIINTEPQMLRNKILIQLKRLQNLQQSLTQQINDPKYEKVKQKNIMDLNVLKKCMSIHRKYFSYILYVKTKGRCNVVLLQKCTNAYKQQLFQLNQNYQKQRLNMKGVDTSKGNIQNEIQN